MTFAVHIQEMLLNKCLGLFLLRSCYILFQQWFFTLFLKFHTIIIGENSSFGYVQSVSRASTGKLTCNHGLNLLGL